MKYSHYIVLLGLLLFTSPNIGAQDLFRYKGQLSAYTHINSVNEYPWWNGLRYIPQMNVNIPVGESRLIDFEASANIFGNAGMANLNQWDSNGRIKPYRLWARYSGNQFEVRAGLQKINFGSATIMRPLMWFDQLDPRDPLQLTDGVWALLGRYYFLNNANIWLWMLYGNNDLKGWEQLVTHRSYPEIGGRMQYPVGTGEAALSYHYRVVSDKIPEHRFGFDARFDYEVGVWIEASWKHLSRNMGVLTNQQLLNVGMDYTFGWGNGLTVTWEQLLAAYDEQPFGFQKPLNFSLLSARYPIGLFDEVSLIAYYDWRNRSSYNFVSWRRQFNRLTLHLMGYINPKSYNIPTQQGTGSMFTGYGLQLMLVYNH
ncbi:MAG: hypothetical protein PHR52_09790 [Fermentimonas sp.]|nr:hypothetical protein [Fermentimonas sp.]MDD4697811.1 hypothetical protein [Fermentimonas sp.]